MTVKPEFYITTAISYTNGEPHIGHAYEAIATDVIARFKRLDGYDVFFMTGTDEHGQKVQRAAEGRGLKPQDYVDDLSAIFRKMNAAMNCNFDCFVRTSDQKHSASAQEFWKRMEANGDIYLSKYSGWYSVRDEAFYDEAETHLDDDGIRRDDRGAVLEWVEEESYFFRLSAYEEKLLAFYARELNFIRPIARRNEVLNFVKSGLNDLSISRTIFNWGVPVPNDKKHIMYVWVDALNSYLTGCNFPDEDDQYWRYWPADLHVVGKDIIRFHAVYWPAFLMSAGLPLPACVFGHGFLLNSGEKMSKSVGNIIDPLTLADRYGIDQIRYFFLREIPFGQDGNYSHEVVVQRINADLSNDLGNLVQRSLSMIARNLDGILPEPGVFSAEDNAILDSADELLEQMRNAMDNLSLHIALERVWRFIGTVNRYFATQEPWSLKNTDRMRMNSVLYVTIEAIRYIAILIQPFMPTAASKLLDLLDVKQDARSFSYLSIEGRLVSNTLLPPPQPIFPRYIETENME